MCKVPWGFEMPKERVGARDGPNRLPVGEILPLQGMGVAAEPPRATGSAGLKRNCRLRGVPGRPGRSLHPLEVEQQVTIVQPGGELARPRLLALKRDA